MRNSLWLMALAYGFGSATGANAQSALTSYICDATPGHFSLIRLELGPEQKSISGVFHPAQLYRHDNWKPSAGIAINDGQEEARIFVGSETPEKDVVKSGMAVTFSLMAGPLNVKKERNELFQVDLGSSVPFSLTLRDKQVDYTLGDRSGSIDVELNGKVEVMLSCSTGGFNFEQLRQF